MPVYTAELYPTAIRNAGVGACNIAAGVALIAVPYLPVSVRRRTFFGFGLFVICCNFESVSGALAEQRGSQLFDAHSDRRQFIGRHHCDVLAGERAEGEKRAGGGTVSFWWWPHNYDGYNCDVIRILLTPLSTGAKLCAQQRDIKVRRSRSVLWETSWVNHHHGSFGVGESRNTNLNRPQRQIHNRETHLDGPRG